MTAPWENLELIDRHLQRLSLAPEDRREALAWLKLGQRLATFALHAASRRAVPYMLGLLAIALAAGAPLLVFDRLHDLAPALRSAPVQVLAETRFSDPGESD